MIRSSGAVEALRDAALSALLVACSTHASTHASTHDASVTDAGSAHHVATDAAAPREPLSGEWLQKLDLPNGGVAYLAPPLGSTEPRPVIVAVHGAMDHPSYMCSAWRVIADAYAFVVCPAGRAAGDLYVWSSGEMIDSAIGAALAAARARYGDRMIDAPMVYTAFSQGATLAASVLTKPKSAHFARASLIEGGYHTLEDGYAAAFKKAGGERVLYTCAQGGCVGSFGASKAALTAVGIPVKVESPGPFGHSMVPPVRASLNAALPWLTEGLPGWEGYATAPKLDAH